MFSTFWKAIREWMFPAQAGNVPRVRMPESGLAIAPANGHAGPPQVPESAEKKSSAQGSAGRERRAKMSTAWEQLIQHLNENEIKYEQESDEQTVFANFRGDVGTYRIIAWIDSENDLFQLFAHSPIRVPEGARPAIAETLARANYGLKVGKFEFDYDEGQIRFQSAHVLLEDSLDGEVIRRFIGVSLRMLNVYIPAVLSVIYGNELPKDAIRHAEGRPVDETGGENS